ASGPPAVLDGGLVALPADAAEVPRPPIEVPLVTPVDATSEVPVPPEVPVDAGHRRPPRPPRDAGTTLARDAELAAAPPPETAVGYGALTAKHSGDQYLNVVLDGRIIDTTPVFARRIPAGTHVVELVDPRTSEVVVKRTVKVEASETVTVLQP
ncbi:MAG TPA: hypothetical protein VF469_15295, partial [Kofleriaceae bacterium]